MADRYEIEALRLAVDIAAEMARYQRNTEARIVELSTAALRQAERDGALRVAEAMLDIALQYRHTDSLIGTMHELRARITRGEFP